MRLRLANEVGGPYESRNVVAEIRGRERPNEVVLLGAHLDSWDLGTGAEDNGVNAALVLDVARAFARLSLAPRRTVRFVLFTGEEQVTHSLAFGARDGRPLAGPITRVAGLGERLRRPVKPFRLAVELSGYPHEGFFQSG